MSRLCDESGTDAEVVLPSASVRAIVWIGALAVAAFVAAPASAEHSNPFVAPRALIETSKGRFGLRPLYSLATYGPREFVCAGTFDRQGDSASCMPALVPPFANVRDVTPATLREASVLVLRPRERIRITLGYAPSLLGGNGFGGRPRLVDAKAGSVVWRLGAKRRGWATLVATNDRGVELAYWFRFLVRR